APVYKKGEEFAMRILPKQIYQTALDSIKWHLAEGHDVCVVTASSPIWVAHWARQLGVQLIGTEYEIKDDKFTGHYAGNNCKGEEKVKRIRNQYDLSEY